MTGSTSPFANQFDWHRQPVAAAACQSTPTPEPINGAQRHSEDTKREPECASAASRIVAFKSKVTYPGSLTARLQNLGIKDGDLPSLAKFGPEWPSTKARESRKSDRDIAPSRATLAEANHLLPDVAPLAGTRPDHPHHARDTQATATELKLEPASTDFVPHAHVQALVLDFQRRQRVASMLVAGSLATAFLLTLAGIVILASFAQPNAPVDAAPAIDHATTVTWQEPQNHGALAAPLLTATAVNRMGKAEPLPVAARGPANGIGSRLLKPAAFHGPSPAPSTPNLILAQAGRQLALAPLLPRRQARYVLIRGLPSSAALSAGNRSASGAWIVPDGDVLGLTLSIGETASGDYPLDLYFLGLDYTPQARQLLVLRVEGTAGSAMSTLTSWPAALLDMAMMSLSADAKATLGESSPLLTRAKRLLGEGDIASARLLLRYLADHGTAEAAYELARTFDAKGLAELGSIGLAGDGARAKSWYERAAQDKNDGAAKRLNYLASAAD